MFFLLFTVLAEQDKVYMKESIFALLAASQPKQLRSQGLKITQSGLCNLKAKLSRITVKILGFGNSTNPSSVSHLRMKEKKRKEKMLTIVH